MENEKGTLKIDYIFNGIEFNHVSSLYAYEAHVGARKYWIDKEANILLVAESIAELNKDTKILNLDKQNLTAFPVEIQQYTQLEALIFRMNKIKNLPPQAFSGLINLKVVDFSSNKIKTLDKDIFSEQPKLYWSDFSSNQINSLDKDIFKGLSHLRFLDFGENKINSLDKDIFNGLSKLKKINFSGNSFSEAEKENLRKILPKCKID
jgi:Leucine-rich repeat (LRR) protein